MSYSGWRDRDDDGWRDSPGYRPRSENLINARRAAEQGKTGWKRESSNYWSADPLLAWKGACPHSSCQCAVYFDHQTGNTVKRCANSDCPWELAAKPEPLSTASPEAETGHLAKRFGGLEYD